MTKRLSDEKLYKLISKFLSDLEMIQHYDRLLQKLAEAQPDFRLLFMRTLYVALQNDFVTRLLRVFDPGRQGYNARKALEERLNIAQSILEANSTTLDDLKKFEEKIKDFRNKYFFHTDEVTVDNRFDPRREYWDSQGLNVSVIMEVVNKTHSVLSDFSEKLPGNTSRPLHYTGDDFARLLSLIDEKGFEHFYQAETGL